MVEFDRCERIRVVGEPLVEKPLINADQSGDVAVTSIAESSYGIVSVGLVVANGKRVSFIGFGLGITVLVDEVVPLSIGFPVHAHTQATTKRHPASRTNLRNMHSSQYFQLEHDDTIHDGARGLHQNLLRLQPTHGMVSSTDEGRRRSLWSCRRSPPPAHLSRVGEETGERSENEEK